jgi:hypothetical protein
VYLAAKVATSGLREAGSVGYIGAGVIIFVWIVMLIGVVYLVKILSK